MTFILPDALLSSESYMRLSDIERKNFSARIRNILDIASEINAWLLNVDDAEDIDIFLDLLEVDVAVNQNAERSENVVPNWVIHSSWGDGADDRPCLQKIPVEMIANLELSLPRLNSSDSEVRKWLKNQALGLENLVSLLLLSKDFSQVTSSLLAINIMMSKTLSGLYISRLRINRL